MLKVWGPVSNLLQLLLGVPPEFTPDAVDKRSWFAKVFSSEGFEFRPRDRFVALGSMALFVLGSAVAGEPTEEESCKGSTVCSCGLRCFEMIFTLLTEVETVYVWFSRIQVRWSSLEGAFTRLIVWRSLCTHTDSQKLLQISCSIGNGQSRVWPGSWRKYKYRCRSWFQTWLRGSGSCFGGWSWFGITMRGRGATWRVSTMRRGHSESGMEWPLL